MEEQTIRKDKKKDKSTRSNCRTDFLSENFDAELVLSLSENEINLPEPNARKFNNLSEYALKSFPSKRPTTDPSKLDDLDLLRKQNEIKERMKEKIAFLNDKKPKSKKNELKNVITLMEKDEIGLLKWLNKRLRVFIRRRHRSKHPCEEYACLFGQLIFFDKHWNLILSDVNETVQFVDNQLIDESTDENKKSNKSNMKLINSNASNQIDSQSTDELNLSTSLISSIDNRRLIIGNHIEFNRSIKISIRERNFNKLFVRGDNIIYISKI